MVRHPRPTSRSSRSLPCRRRRRRFTASTRITVDHHRHRRQRLLILLCHRRLQHNHQKRHQSTKKHKALCNNRMPCCPFNRVLVVVLVAAVIMATITLLPWQTKPGPGPKNGALMHHEKKVTRESKAAGFLSFCQRREALSVAVNLQLT